MSKQKNALNKLHLQCICMHPNTFLQWPHEAVAHIIIHFEACLKQDSLLEHPHPSEVGVNTIPKAIENFSQLEPSSKFFINPASQASSTQVDWERTGYNRFFTHEQIHSPLHSKICHCIPKNALFTYIKLSTAYLNIPIHICFRKFIAFSHNNMYQAMTSD